MDTDWLTTQESEKDVDLVLADKYRDKLFEQHKKDGFREGYDQGKESKLQEGFNEGFSSAAGCSFSLSAFSVLLHSLHEYEGIDDKQKYVVDSLLLTVKNEIQKTKDTWGIVDKPTDLPASLAPKPPASDCGSGSCACSGGSAAEEGIEKNEQTNQSCCSSKENSQGCCSNQSNPQKTCCKEKTAEPERFDVVNLQNEINIVMQDIFASCTNSSISTVNPFTQA